MNDVGTTAVDGFFSRLESYGDRPALFWRGDTLTYRGLLRHSAAWHEQLPTHGIQQGSVVGYIGDYWPDVVAFTLALMRAGAVAVPFSTAAEREMPTLLDIAHAEALVTFSPDAPPHVRRLPATAGRPALIQQFLELRHPGCVVFTSGSTGRPKGILHDFARLLTKFEQPRPAYRTLLFLLLDHLGGLNTLLSVLANGGLGVTAERRTPDAVCSAIAAARVELLPTTPAFLTMLIASNARAEFDLSSLRLVTYGTDTMPEQTLKAVAAAFPGVKLQQTYGLSEVGVLRSKSKESSSLMLRVGGDGFETKIVDGTLWVRSRSAMVGYLNAPSPFDEDGWLNTGDLVEVDGDHVRILGRESDIINVGGQKVFPAEVESVLLQAENVADATVFAEDHPLLGRVVAATVSTKSPEDPLELRRRLRKHCLDRLAPFKVPARITQSERGHQNPRFKKIRRSDPA